MTRRRALPLCLLAIVTLCVGSCAGRGAGTNAGAGGRPAASSSPFATAGDRGASAATSASGTESAGGTAQSGGGGGGNPGGPGPDPNGGGSRSGSQAGSRPGAPYDIEAFENQGAPLTAFRDSYRADSGCGTPPNERCHVVEQSTGDGSDPTQCVVTKIAYNPPSQPPDWPEGGPRPKIQEGTTVTATILCPGAPGYDEAVGNVPAGGSGADGGSPSTDTTGDTSSGSSAPST